MKKLIIFLLLLTGKCYAQDTTKVLMQVFYRDLSDTSTYYTFDTKIIEFDQVFGYVIEVDKKIYYRREDFTLLPSNAFVFKAMKWED